MVKSKFWLSQKKYDEMKKSTPLPYVDLVILRGKKGKREVLIFTRNIPPGKGRLCLIGGRQRKGGSLKDAVDRQAREVGLRVRVIRPFGYNFPAWVEDSEKQDTTKQATTCLYPVEILSGKPKRGREAKNPTWVSANDLPNGFLFDQREKIVKVLKQLEKYKE
jgi:ADP-ribose pyrophosphatase YjhB (NUDIX family)